MSLEQKLAEMRAESAKKFPEDIKEKMARSTEELRASGITDKALGVGATAPSFSLPNTAGETVSSAALLEKGPLVVTFYRGVW